MSNLLPYQQLQLKTSHVLRHDLWHGWSAAEESRKYNELWLVMDGGAYLKVDGHEYRLKKGDVCLLPDILSKENGCDIAEHFDVLVAHFEATLLSASLFEHIRCTDWVVHPNPQVFEQLYASLAACRREKIYAPPSTLQEVVSDRHAFFAALEVFFAHTQIIETQTDDWLSDTLHFIAHNFHQKLQIDLLAHRVAMHPKHFARCFRERMGISPGKYMASVRLERSILLLYEGLSLETISERVGFQSVQQFFRFFKQQTGMSPRAYQKNHIKGEVQKQ